MTWTSTNTSAATVSASGLVTAVALGGTTIVASSEGQDGSASVTVVPPPVATVTVAPTAPSLTPGASIQLVPTLKDGFGTVLTGRVVTWSSANNGVATVSNAGLVTGVATSGSVTITATSEGKTGTTIITMVAPVVTSVAVTPAVTAVANGGNTPLTAIVRDQNNVIMTGQTVTWATSNAAIATVSPTGLVTGVAPGGPVTITATIAGRSATASVTVTSNPCDATTPIAIGQILAGSLATSDCALADGSYMDLFQIQVTGNGRIQVDVNSFAFDAYLILFLKNPDGTSFAVGADDNSGGGTNARLVRDVIAGETYLIGANSLLPNVTGGYQVSVQTGTFMIAGAGARIVRVRDLALATTKMTMAAKVLR